MPRSSPAALSLGLRLAVDTVTGIDYVFTDKVMVDGVDRASDIARVAVSWGGPRIVWSVIVAAISLGLVGAGLWAAFRGARRPAAGRATQGR
jgi:hypothetical protein